MPEHDQPAAHLSKGACTKAIQGLVIIVDATALRPYI